MRDMRRRMSEMGVRLNGKNSQKKKEEERRPRRHSGSFDEEKKHPKNEKDGEENPSLRKERQLKLAQINAAGVENEDRNERKGEGSAHLGPGRTEKIPRN
jgi:hypothetical protein